MSGLRRRDVSSPAERRVGGAGRRTSAGEALGEARSEHGAVRVTRSSQPRGRTSCHGRLSAERGGASSRVLTGCVMISPEDRRWSKVGSPDEEETVAVKCGKRGGEFAGQSSVRSQGLPGLVERCRAEMRVRSGWRREEEGRRDGWEVGPAGEI